MAKKRVLKAKKKGAKSVKKAVKTRKKKVLPIPKDYHVVTPFLHLKEASKAIEFYKTRFGAKEVFRFVTQDQRIGYAELKIGDSKIMLSDEFPEREIKGPEAGGGPPVSFNLYVKKVDEVFHKVVSAGGEVKRPVEDRFYGDRSGSVKDPFGIIWHISTHVEDVTPKEVRKRAEKAYSNQ